MILEGKTINFMGDSITEGAGVNDRANNRYDNVIKRKYGLKAVCNYGIGGTRLAHQYKPSNEPRHDLNMCARAYDMSWAADVIVVYAGVNDYLHGDAPFGEIGDKTNATYCGAVDWMMSFLTKTYHWTKVIFVTPAKCVFHGITDCRNVSNYAPKLDDARPLRDYCDVIIETGKKYGISVLDLYDALPIDMLDDEVRAKYAPDGLHFNDLGHEVLADTIAEFLKSV